VIGHFVAFRSKYFPELHVLKHTQSFSNMRDIVLHPYKTAGKIIILYIVFFDTVRNRFVCVWSRRELLDVKI
jgi:hypothetical protein